MEGSGIFASAERFFASAEGAFARLPAKGEETRAFFSRMNGDGGPEGLVALHDAWAHEKALCAGLRFEAFAICPPLANWGKISDIAERCAGAAPRRYIISDKAYARVADHTDGDGILSLARLPIREPEDLALGGDAVVFVLDGLTKPGNVGVILRSCDGAGVDAVFTCNLRTRATHPNAVKSSMGAVFYLPTCSFASAEDCKGWLNRNGFTVYVADPEADNRFDSADYRGRIAVVFGNEHVGASGAWYRGGARALTIPMSGACDSLNVSVAASIIAFAIKSARSRA